MMVNGGGRFGGTAFSDVGLLLTKADVPLLPETKQFEDDIPGMDGMLDLGMEYGPRPINLTFQVLAKNGEGEYQTKLQQIAKMFAPHRGAQPLILERAPGKQWLAKYNGTMSIERIAQLGEFTLPLKAHYPFASSVPDNQQPLRLGLGYVIGMGYHLGMGPTGYSFPVTTSPRAFSVYHAGTYFAKPIIRITGTGSNISIANDTTAEAMMFNGALSGGDTLEIDCSRQRITKNGVNAFAGFSGVYPRLAEGNNNFTITATAANLTVVFIFRHTYLF
ncbi:phage tail family protein [Paenibacillus sp. MBLB4367]|uniref:phage tail family protein n=1 Tax=Paenibacillus sp. MBLB4367 TaxID=3384767 RepID=UPI00390836CB